MTDIIEQARELLAACQCDYRMPLPDAQVAALCRALIARDGALRDLLDTTDVNSNRYRAAYRAGRRALADDEIPREG